MSRCSGFLLLVVGLFGGFAAPAQSPPEGFIRALKLHQSGDLNAAINAYREFLKTNPDSVEAHSNLGAVFAGLGRHQEAVEQYQNAIQLQPDNGALRLNLGLAFYKSARIRNAADELARAVTLDPNAPWHKNALLVLADCYLTMGENKKVIELLGPLQAVHADDRALLYLLGTALIRDGQLAKGQSLVDRILRDGDSAEARLMLGTAHMTGRDFAAAAKEFAKAVELNPKLASAHGFYGRALLATGDRARAQEEFWRELEINPNDFDSNLYLAVMLKQDQRYDEALKHLGRAVQVRPGTPDARYQVASIYVSTGRLTDAQKILEELIREAPKFVEAHVSLATVYYRLKRKEDGDRHREIVRKLNEEIQAKAPRPGSETGTSYRGEATGAVAPAAEVPVFDFEALKKEAETARDAGRLDPATNFYRQAVALRPDWDEGWWYLGTILYEADRFEEAREAFEKLAALQPKGGAGWAMLGLCEYRLTNYAKALDYLQTARALGMPAGQQLTDVAWFHLAVLMNRFGRPEASLQLLYGLARKQDESPRLLEAMGLSALSLPHLPGETPADRLPLVIATGRAQFLMASRKVDDALKAAQELLTRHPDAPGLRYIYGVFLLPSNADAALEQFRRELEFSPDHVSARLQIAFEYIKRQEYSSGLTHAEQAVKLAPDLFAARNALGRILLELGDTSRAIIELEAGMKLAPDSPETLYALARAYARAGRPEDAARARAEFNRLDKLRRERTEK